MAKAKSTRGYWQRTRRLALWFVFFWCLLALAVPLAAPPFEAIAVLSIPLGYYLGAQGLLIALVIAAFIFAYRQRRLDGTLLYGELRPPGVSSSQPPARKGGLPGSTGALAMATDWLSGATLIALAGALYGLGHDGLVWMLGLVAGVALGGAVIAPHLHRAEVRSILEFVAQRFGHFVAALALPVVLLATALVLAANLQALTHALQALLPGAPFVREAAFVIATLAFLAAGLKAARIGVTIAQAVAYTLLFALLTMPVVLATSDFVPGHFTFGSVLKQIGASELHLLEKELADPVTLKMFTRPFTTATATGGILLTLSLALGLAAMPHVLRRPIVARSCEGARLMPATALLLIVLAVIALPPLVAQARLGVLSFVGESASAPSPKLVGLGASGLIEVCGAPAPSPAAIAQACAAQPDPAATLRLDDISIPRDRALFAAPALAGLPLKASQAIAVTVALAALLAAAWLGATLSAEAATLMGRDAGGRGPLALVALVAVAAAAPLIVAVGVADVMTLLAWGLAVAAAGLAPLLLAGIWVLRANAVGAALAILAGVGVTLYYVIATRYFAVSFYETWSTLSSAGYGAIADFEAAKQALAAAVPGADRQAARLAYIDSARAVANWWGLRDVAAGALGSGVAFVVLILVSFVTPRPGAPGTVSLIARMRGLSPRV